MPFATDGEPVMMPLVVPRQSGWQDDCPHPAAGKAERLPSNEPMYTTPFAAAGPDSKMALPAWPVHSAEQVLAPQPVALKAFSLPSCEPTYTTPFAIAGEEVMWPPVVPVHKGLQVEVPHPAA